MYAHPLLMLTYLLLSKKNISADLIITLYIHIYLWNVYKDSHQKPSFLHAFSILHVAFDDGTRFLFLIQLLLISQQAYVQ